MSNIPDWVIAMALFLAVGLLFHIATKLDEIVKLLRKR